MTKEEAVSKAADWWTEMIFKGIWDNGDAKTEAIVAGLRSLTCPPQPSDAPNLRKAFIELLSYNDNLYCDYGNRDIDDTFKKYNLPYRSSIHCPQKAGTQIYEENGEWRVKAKGGYGQSYERV